MIEHLSYSSISSYIECGRNWQFKYLEKQPTNGSSALIFGSAWHETVEMYLTRSNGQKLLDFWPEGWQKVLDDPRNKDFDWGMDKPEEHYNVGVAWANHPDVIEVVDKIKPQKINGLVTIEKKVLLTVPGVPVPIIGFIDIITDDGIPGDFKTSSKSWSNDKATGSMQTLFYLAALNQEGITVPDNRFRHYVFVKNKTPKVQVIEHTHKMSELFFLFSIIQKVWKAIEAGIYIENPDSWKCKPAYCDFYHLCRGKYA